MNVGKTESCDVLASCFPYKREWGQRHFRDKQNPLRAMSNLYDPTSLSCIENRITFHQAWRFLKNLFRAVLSQMLDSTLLSTMLVVGSQ